MFAPIFLFTNIVAFLFVYYMGVGSVLANLNEQQIVPDDIIKINNTYYLYYTNRQYPYYDIRLAISQDGINFTRYNQNPILFPENSWEGTGIYSASVVYEDNQYNGFCKCKFFRDRFWFSLF